MSILMRLSLLFAASHIAFSQYAISNADGRLELFELAGTLHVYHISQTSPGGSWGSWLSLGGSLSSNPAAAINADGRIEIFALGTSGEVYHDWQVSPGGAWSGWSALSGTPSISPNCGATCLAVASNADGRLEVFAISTDGQAYHTWQQSPGGAWTLWYALGGTNLGGPVCAKANKDGRLQVFSQDTSGTVRTVSQTSPGGAWSGWSSLGTPPLVNNAPAQLLASVGSNADGRLEIFAWQYSNGSARVPCMAKYTGWFLERLVRARWLDRRFGTARAGQEFGWTAPSRYYVLV